MSTANSPEFVDALRQQKKYNGYLIGLIESPCAPANFSDLHINGHHISNLNFSTSKFINCKVSNCTFENCDFNFCNFSNATLENCDFFTSNLTNINCSKTTMKQVVFRCCNIFSGTFYKANIHESNFENCNLNYLSLVDSMTINVSLCGSSLELARFEGAGLRLLRNFTPNQMLLAWWGKLSENLCRKAMAFDASNHENPKLFDIWHEDKICPYNNVRYDRSCNFLEDSKLWDNNIKAPSALELMIELIKEKCKDSDWHENKPAV